MQVSEENKFTRDVQRLVDATDSTELEPMDAARILGMSAESLKIMEEIWPYIEMPNIKIVITRHIAENYTGFAPDRHMMENFDSLMKDTLDADEYKIISKDDFIKNHLSLPYHANFNKESLDSQYNFRIMKFTSLKKMIMRVQTTEKGKLFRNNLIEIEEFISKLYKYIKVITHLFSKKQIEAIKAEHARLLEELEEKALIVEKNKRRLEEKEKKKLEESKSLEPTESIYIMSSIRDLNNYGVFKVGMSNVDKDEKMVVLNQYKVFNAKEIEDLIHTVLKHDATRFNQQDFFIGKYLDIKKIVEIYVDVEKKSIEIRNSRSKNFSYADAIVGIDLSIFYAD